jgi:Ser/Thr protein kinase RdoA (MazF antagonist)
LRVHRHAYRGRPALDAELDFLEVCARTLPADVAVPQPRTSDAGDRIVEITDPSTGERRLCTALSWVEGQVLRPGRGLGPRATEALGRALGLVHERGQDRRFVAGEHRPRWDTTGLLSAGSYYGNGWPVLRELLTGTQLRLIDHVTHQTTQAFSELEHVPGATGWIHGDFILLNCHLRRTAHGWTVGIIDFDDAGWGHVSYDLATMIGNLTDSPQFPVLRAALLDGYRSIRQLPEAAETCLPALTAARHAASCLWAASAVPDRTWLRRLVAMRLDEIDRCLEQ